MRHGQAAEERLRRPSPDLDMDELPVFGRIGEGIDPRLVDGEPIRHANFFADATANFVAE